MSDTSVNPELKPEIAFVFDLLRQLTNGSIRVPKFQRPFVWRRAQMLDLLDSIRRQYPIGSLLAWETDQPIARLEAVGPVPVQESNATTPAYLLDGHQRLSTLAGALVDVGTPPPFEDEDPARWNIYYNAAEERFEHLPLGSPPAAAQFPLTKILDTVEFLEECQRVIDADEVNGREYVARMQLVARAFQTYRIPIIRIRDTGLTEAVEIFARLNSKGQPMTPDQMVSALLYREGSTMFDLSVEIDDMMSRLESLGFEELDRAAVLRTLLAAVGEPIYRTDWTRIARSRREELLKRLETVVPVVSDALAAAARFLRQECGVTNARLLPYSMQLVVLASFFVTEPSPSDAQAALLRRWFWASSFASWFGGTNPSRVNSLVREVMDEVARDRVSPSIRTMDLEAPALPMAKAFDMRSARARATLLVLLTLEPRDAFGQKIERPDDLVQRFGPEAVGHILPTVKGSALHSSPANRILKPNPEDRGFARSWLRDVTSPVRDVVYASHAVPPDAIAALDTGDGSEFLEKRLDQLRAVEASFMVAHDVVPPESDQFGPAVLDVE